MNTVYYHVSKIDGEDVITVTEENYFRQNHALDDGSGALFGAITDAMTDIGADEIAESVFALEGIDVDHVVNSMLDYGFELKENPEFSAMVQSLE